MHPQGLTPFREIEEVQCQEGAEGGWAARGAL